ncbi:uncharacterized protein EAE98_008888 [Botrytis deweyae]|uniref:N-acetyltransferase domain-containing protein n=1 Tax=Botrytis deweyae TaxID=2478750 RepID=A0ABQ7IDD6_9HELO|nr:uncharacterized protein EAE98_008888 [Botrytis deweyae]KAF7920859.1 hypothetical protein EAE98_008888 [Botrytis deweyae]
MDSNTTQTQFPPSNPLKPHQNLKLVPLTPTEHLDDFWEIWREERGVIWSRQAPMKTKEEALEFLKYILPRTEKNPGGEAVGIDKFAILVEGEGEGDRPKCVGFVGTNRPSPEGLEMGYCVNPDYYGNGYATWGVTEFLKIYWGMEERSHIPHLVAKIDPRNKASERIIAKVGARKGEVLENFYSRRIDEGKLSDIRCWYLDRPAVGGESEGK